MRTKADVQAGIYLKNISKKFVSYLGDMEALTDEMVFKSPPMALNNVKIRIKKNKFLFGGVFSLQIIGEHVQPELTEDVRTISIGYKGRMIKGDAYFKDGNAGQGRILARLNGNSELISTLNGLDLEKGEIRKVDEKLEICLTPLGGSYMYMTIPPMQYTGAFSQRDIEGICRTLSLIGETMMEQSA